MRMYNPEWEALKDFAYTPRFTDLQFDLQGRHIPVDHGYALFSALSQLVGWIDGVEGIGLHPVHGAPAGLGADDLVLNRRVKLMLRLPVEHVSAAQSLVGKEFKIGAEDFKIGVLKEKPLMPCSTLYASSVVCNHEDEVEFLAEVREILKSLEIQGGLIPGKRRKINTPDGDVSGYSLMLHDVGLEQSLKIQELGVGQYRKFGCGIFVPHKSIKEVVID